MFPQGHANWNLIDTYSSNINTTGLHALPITYSGTTLPNVMDSPATELDDLEWLDAQVEEVCALAR